MPLVCRLVFAGEFRSSPIIRAMLSGGYNATETARRAYFCSSRLIFSSFCAAPGNSGSTIPRAPRPSPIRSSASSRIAVISASQNRARSAAGTDFSGRMIRKPTDRAAGSVNHQGLLGLLGSVSRQASSFDGRRAAERQSAASASHDPPRITRGNSRVGQRIARSQGIAWPETLFAAISLYPSGE